MSDPEIISLEKRLDRFEDTISSEIHELRKKIDDLALQQVKSNCPSPGMCLPLNMSLTEYKKETKERIDSMETRITKIETLQNKLIGGGIVLIVVMDLFGPFVRKLLKLE